MQTSLFVTALLGAVAHCAPVVDRALDPTPDIAIGKICTEAGLAGDCSDLILSIPNECKTSVSNNLPFSRSISSIDITKNETCAFFQLEACINPVGTHALLVQGPATVNDLPSHMDDSIQAYICGEVALMLVGPSENPPAPGTVIVTEGADDSLALATYSRNLDLVRTPAGRALLLMHSDEEIAHELNSENLPPNLDLSELTAHFSREVEAWRKRTGDDAVLEKQNKMQKRSTDDLRNPDGRGATIWKQQNFEGEIIPRDQTRVPAYGMDTCTDLDQLYGGWDAVTRSLVVQPQFKCFFYTEKGCPENGEKLELGWKEDLVVVVPVLEKRFDQKIRSVICAKL